MSYSSPANSKKLDPAAKQLEQQIKLLESILKRPGNDNCADCGQKGPRWASINLGIFVCIRCSGIHRNMGTHISKVKSVSLDKWAPEMIRTVDVIGNLNAKRIYEGKCPPSYPRPREADTYGVEQWIRDKYDRKKFYDAAAAAEIFAGISGATNSPQPKQSSPAVDEEQARKLRREQRRKQRELEAEKARSASPQVQQYTPAPAPVAAPSVDLLLGGPVAQPAAPQVQQQFVPQQQFTPSSADAFFSEFQTSSAPVTFQTNSQASFFQEPNQQAQPQVQAQPEPPRQPEPPKASKEQILSLFKADQNPSNNTGGLFSLNGFGSAPTPQATPQAPNYAALNSMGMNNMSMNAYGMNPMAMNNGMGMNNMGMNNMGAYGMNTMGMNNGMGMNAYAMNMGMNNGMGMNTMGNTMGMNNLSGFNAYGSPAMNMSAAVRPNPAATTSSNTWGAATNNTFATPTSTQNNFSGLNW